MASLKFLQIHLLIKSGKANVKTMIDGRNGAVVIVAFSYERGPRFEFPNLFDKQLLEALHTHRCRITTWYGQLHGKTKNFGKYFLCYILLCAHMFNWLIDRMLWRLASSSEWATGFHLRTPKICFLESTSICKCQQQLLTQISSFLTWETPRVDCKPCSSFAGVDQCKTSNWQLLFQQLFFTNLFSNYILKQSKNISKTCWGTLVVWCPRITDFLGVQCMNSAQLLCQCVVGKCSTITLQLLD